MITKRFFFCLPVRRNLFLKTLNHFHSNFSILADSNVTNNNAPSQNLFLHLVTTRLNADDAKMWKYKSSLQRLKFMDDAEQFVSILNRHGCNEDQIVKIIRFRHCLLSTSAESLLEPKIQLLNDFGIGGENLIKIVTGLTWILGNCKLEVLRSNLELLKIVFPTQDLLIRAIRSNYHILGPSLLNSFKPSVAFWEDFGFRGTELSMFLLVDPWVLTHTSLTPEERDLIRKIGIHKESNMYKYVVNIVAMSGVKELEARIDNLQLCGLSPEEALQIVRADPTVLSKSYFTIIKEKMDFMLNHMGLSVDFVAKHPRVFTLGLEKVMRPRFLVLQNMTAMKGEEEVDPRRLFAMLIMTEAKFISQIIQGHPESAALWTVYKNAIANASKAQT